MRRPFGIHIGAAFVVGVLLSAAAWLSLHQAGAGTSIGEDSLNYVSITQSETRAEGELDGRQSVEADKSNVHSGERESSAIGNRSTGKSETNGERYKQPMIKVFLTKSNTVESVPLEAYVKGVIAAEMPLDFETEAMEAQALAARTYIVRRLWLNDHSGMTVTNADVTDTQEHQVYRSIADMQKLRLEDESGWKKIESAVNGTVGEIIVYGGEPIEALFFSTSNGYTENSENVFPAKVPYLRSVPSPWDKEYSPRAKETIEMSLTDFYDKLGVEFRTIGKTLTPNKQLRVIEWTDGHRVERMIAGGKTFTGEQVRDKLGLRSASFDWKISGDKIKLVTYGSGHGVGMSQWGAEGMAKAGKTASQIVAYYYSGTRIEEVSKLADRSENRL
ncbi:stage II sporulation protein D [Cohnella lupini]|uniref:Stage II sporulation protein D n=1 Tax=Cohnella lupini TaxID=1294267 RepID=A0A3D9I932_9BACL|nr:stage II sporulation protein D [Cohnella lupini]RED57666.1 stage II sporulation protein D [Cohnella lupini]